MSEPLIVFENDRILVANKPTGYLVHRTKIDKYEDKILQIELRDLVGCKVYPVHRIDKGTSGLCLFAKDEGTVKYYQALWTENRVNKSYRAICRGWVDERITVDRPLEKEKKKSQQRSLAEAEKKSAISHFQLEGKLSWKTSYRGFDSIRYSLVNIDIETGRRHQIRRHAAGMSHPIIGDSTYGDLTHNRMFKENLGVEGLLLQAKGLHFEDPIDQQRIELSIDPDPRIQKLLGVFERVN